MSEASREIVCCGGPRVNIDPFASPSLAPHTAMLWIESSLLR